MTDRPTIAAYMARDLVTLSPDMEINRAMQVLLDQHISGAPVVDAGGQLIGILSQKDCLRAALNASYYQELGGIVADYMTSDVETLPASLSIVEAGEHILKSRYRRFPVIDNGRIVGQLSRADLLRALAGQWQPTKMLR